jgi:hypothetical protein
MRTDPCARARAAHDAGDLTPHQLEAIERGLACGCQAKRDTLLDERIAGLTSLGISYTDALVRADNELRAARTNHKSHLE